MEIKNDVFSMDVKDRVENYVSQGVEEEILDQLFKCVPSISVMYAPPGSGKSSLATHVAKLACERHETSGALIVNDYGGVNKRCSFNAWFLLDKLGLPEDTNKNCLNDCLSTKGDKPYLLILDQFDDIVRHSSVKHFVKPLAQQLRLDGKVVCLICVNRRKNYEAIIGWNGGEKIAPLGVSFKGTSLEEGPFMWCNPLSFFF